MHLVHTLTAHRQAVWSIAFSPDGKTLASAGSDGAIILWNVNLHQQVGTLRLPDVEAVERGIDQVTFSPDGNVLAALRKDGTLRFWRAASWTEIEARENE